MTIAENEEDWLNQVNPKFGAVVDKTSHLKPHTSDFNNRFGWSREIINGAAAYSIWRILKGKRYTVHCYAISKYTPRSTLANDIVIARISLRKYIARCLLAGKTVEYYDTCERVETKVTKYRQNPKL